MSAQGAQGVTQAGLREPISSRGGSLTFTNITYVLLAEYCDVVPMSRIYTLSGTEMHCGYDLRLSQNCAGSPTKTQVTAGEGSKKPARELTGVRQSILGRVEHPWKRPAEPDLRVQLSDREGPQSEISPPPATRHDPDPVRTM